jgi:hypothetical protein
MESRSTSAERQGGVRALVFDRRLIRIEDLTVEVTDASRAGFVRRAIGAIAQTHRSPSGLDGLLVRIETMRLDLGYGRFDPTGITIDRRAPERHATLVHEFGHAIDFHAIGSQTFATESGLSVIADWRNTVEDSAGVRELRRLQALLTSSDSADARLRGYIAYLLRPTELFARTYAQWISVRSQDHMLVEEIERSRRTAGPRASLVQWQEEDFVAIGIALDEIFRRLGWIR